MELDQQVSGVSCFPMRIVVFVGVAVNPLLMIVECKAARSV